MVEFDRLQRAALEFHGVLVTPEAAPGLFPVSSNTREQLTARLAERVSKLPQGAFLSPLYRPSGQLEFLKDEVVDRLQSELSSLLLSLLGSLTLPDVRTEVLASWLALSDSSDSSSVTAGGESAGKLPTSSRIKIVAQRVARVDGDAGEMTFECDHFRVVGS